MSNEKGFSPRALGEVAIRCADLDSMARFYTEVIGLEPLLGGHRKDIMFFRIAEGFGGHTTVLALFEHPAGTDARPITGEKSALHHIALSLPLEEQDAVLRWYRKLNQPHRIEEFPWIGWRGIFTQDPEGNTVELVAFDPELKAPDKE